MKWTRWIFVVSVSVMGSVASALPGYSQSNNSQADYYFSKHDKNRDGRLSKEEQSRTLQSQVTQWDKNKDGYIAKDEYTAYLDAYFKSRDQRYSDYQFSKQDKNRDGVLTKDEQSQTLQTEVSKWDKNRNGVVEADEYSTYFRTFMQARRDQEIAKEQQRGSSDSRKREPEKKQPTPVEEPKAIVYHAGNLPKDLPKWYAEFDRDRDGQIALFEWKRAARSVTNLLAEFRSRDANADGFITVEEMLRFQQLEEEQDKAKSVEFKEKVITPASLNSGSYDPQNGNPSTSSSDRSKSKSSSYDKRSKYGSSSKRGYSGYSKRRR